MNTQTHLATELDAIDPAKIQYYKNIKELLADIQILARILKYTVDEVADLSLAEIMDCIDKESIRIGTVPVSPGLTNTRRVESSQAEDAIPGESYITFDLRLSLTLHKKSFKIIINPEAQKSSDVHQNGYHLENRITYYMARLISSQKEVEFFHSDYDNIKKIYSIWICMEGETDAIRKVSFTSEAVFGELIKPMVFDKMCAVIVQMRKQTNQTDSKNRLIAMLEDLLRDEEPHIKKRKLKEKYDMQMTVELEGRLANMCNLSDLIEERGMKRGMERGIQCGIERGMEQGISAMIFENLEENTSKEWIIEKLQKHFSLSYDKAETYFDKYANIANH